MLAHEALNVLDRLREEAILRLIEHHHSELDYRDCMKEAEAIGDPEEIRRAIHRLLDSGRVEAELTWRGSQPRIILRPPAAEPAEGG